jgi:DNA repair protein RadA
MIHSEGGSISPIREEAEKLDTGSLALNDLLGGGLATCAITDVYGAAATGKTQFAFQNALIASVENIENENRSKPTVFFVDCAGSFRPERIAEMAEARGLSPNAILDRIYSVYVRSVSEQKEASERFLNSDLFNRSKLLIVDEITTNFAAEYPGESENHEDSYVSRYIELSTYVRNLAYISLTRRIAILLTNSVRSRLVPSSQQREISKSLHSSSIEVETTGDIISQFALFRLLFTKRGSTRQAVVIQPFILSEKPANFKIERKGIVP